MNKYIFLVLFASFRICAGSVDGIPFESWKEFSNELKKDKSLIIYFTFEEKMDNPVLRNQALSENASLFDTKLKSPIWIPGRWKNKTAIRLDAISISTRPYNIENKQFSLEMWFRKNGAGIKRGNKNTKSGTLAGQAGYNNGWRITTKCGIENQPVQFSLGGRKTRFSIKSRNVQDGIWHHLAITWDGKFVKIYIDGELNKSDKFTGEYTSVASEKKWENFKIGGYTGFGVGSVKLDVGEVAVFKRALSAKEIKAHRYMISVTSSRRTAQ